MLCKLFVFRHAETKDNNRKVFSGWRDSDLSQKGIFQSKEIAEQLKGFKIDYAFTSHLKRARHTLKIVLRDHPHVPIFIDDRLIERCYGLFQGRSKRKLETKNPKFFKSFHRGYHTVPPDGESLEMVEKRVTTFFKQLTAWLKQNPSNVAISCHNNSIRPLRRNFEKLSTIEMCTLETPQNKVLIYSLDLDSSSSTLYQNKKSSKNWVGVQIPKQVRLATDPLNPLRKYY